MPFVVIAAFAIAAATGGGSSTSPTGSAPGPLPALSVSASPDAAAQSAACTKLLAKLPVSLDGLAQRIVHSPSLFVTAWGNPPVILRCGVARPKDLVPGSSEQLRYDSGFAYDLVTTKDAAVYTTVDRGPYISITFPSGVQPANHLPTLSAVIAAALPAVCTTDSAVADVTKLCTRRP